MNLLSIPLRGTCPLFSLDKAFFLLPVLEKNLSFTSAKAERVLVFYHAELNLTTETLNKGARSGAGDGVSPRYFRNSAYSAER